MAARFNIPNFEKANAVILHPAHPTIALLERQLKGIGLNVTVVWPDLPATAVTADVVFYDTDHGYDAQFPWNPGEAPMPMIALVGSEAPGRIEWASRMGADALLVKPLGAAGVFSSLLMSRQSFEVRRGLGAEIDDLRRRLSARQTVVQAVLHLSQDGKSQDEAYDMLRQLAMAWRVTMEEAADQIMSNAQDGGHLRDYQ